MHRSLFQHLFFQKDVTAQQGDRSSHCWQPTVRQRVFTLQQKQGEYKRAHTDTDTHRRDPSSPGNRHRLMLPSFIQRSTTEMRTMLPSHATPYRAPWVLPRHSSALFEWPPSPWWQHTSHHIHIHTTSHSLTILFIMNPEIKDTFSPVCMFSTQCSFK